MTHLPQKLAIPEGLTARRSMHWSLKLLLVGLTVSFVGTAGYMTTVFMSIGAAIDAKFPASYRAEVREKMSRVSPLLREIVIFTECPVVPSALDPIQRRAKIISAQLSQHHGLTNPYIEHESLKKTQNLWSIFIGTMVAHMIVEYKFTSDEQLDLFLAGVTFDIDEDNSVKGVIAASEKLLGKYPEKLTPTEVARLASAIDYPRPYIGNPDPPLTQAQILRKMKEQDLISKRELEVALRDPSVSRERYPASESEEE